ncbi:unnamed protein product, partial [marine sediment metagenome]
VRNIVGKDSSIAQKSTGTSLIEQFMYPKFGPGQMWEEVSRIIRAKGGEIYLSHKVTGLNGHENRIIGVKVKNILTGEETTKKADYCFSTMPVRDLVESLAGDVPRDVQQVANGLIYRDFITVALLLKKLKI